MRHATLQVRVTVLCSGAEEGTSAGSLVLHKSHYLGFGAAGALLHHLKHSLRLALAPRSVQVGAVCWHPDKQPAAARPRAAACPSLGRDGGMLCAAATPPCCLAVSLLCWLRQVEFQGIRHHMSLDRDVINSLELLAPSRHAQPAVWFAGQPLPGPCLPSCLVV